MPFVKTFVLIITLSTIIFAQTDPKFEAYLAAERANLPAEGELLYNCANIGSYRYGGGNGATKKIVNADSTLPFGKAAQLYVKETGANAWEPQFQSPANVIPVNQGDVLFYIFYIRVLETSDASGNGKGFFYIQRNTSPWTGLGSSSLTFMPVWRKIYVAAHAGEDFPVGTMEFTIHLGYFTQRVEVGGIIALNLGPGIDPEDLPQNPLFWDGMAADAPWRADAAARIEQHRKGDLNVVVKNQNGEPIKNATVKVEMLNHAFGFGTFMSELALQSSTNANKYKDAVLTLFNRATTPFYMGDGSWGWYGPGNSKTQYPALAGWLQDHGILTKGHVLIWPSWTWMPPFFRDYENDPEGMKEAIDEHLETLVPIGEDKGLIEWDVVNEPHINHDVMDICGDDIMVHWYNKVHELDPKPRLILNEYNILMGGGDPAFQADFERYIELLLNGGAPLGGIGMQCHFDENLPGIPQVLSTLDRFAKYNLPIQVTEFDIDTIQEEAQADFTRDFFTAIFSHPMTDKIVMWGFWEGDQWKPNGSMIRTNWTYKPNYYVYDDLVFHQWWTKEEGLSTRDGAYQTRGFLGDYKITAIFDGHTVSTNTVLTKDGAAVEIQIPTTETGLEQKNEAPTDFGLKQNYPNPFNASTTINYNLPQPGNVKLTVYNALCQGVAELVNDFQVEGSHAVLFDAQHLPTGIYLYQVQINGRSSEMKKMLLLK